MAGLTNHLPFLRRIAWLAMLLPFLALSAVPTGLMPAKTGDGTLTLVLCTADGPREMTVDLGGEEPAAAKPGCPWALAQMAVVLGQPEVFVVPSVVLPHTYVRALPTDLLPPTIPGPRTARAPPATV
jgi:hypothetical protein